MAKRRDNCNVGLINPVECTKRVTCDFCKRHNSKVVAFNFQLISVFICEKCYKEYKDKKGLQNG